MANALLGLLAETFIHPGAGQSGSAIDLPVAREAATSYPFIAGSSFKGALRDAVFGIGDDRTNGDTSSGEEKGSNWKLVFGDPDQAGTLLVSDVRLLLLPVRSLTSAYCWVVCTHLLERFSRDRKRAGFSCVPQSPPLVKAGHYMRIGQGECGGDEVLYLEERSFRAEQCSDCLPTWVEEIKGLIADAAASDRVARQLVLLCDDDFAWFAKNGLAVHARNVLDERKKSGNLWYEETLPPDTFMYAILSEREPGSGTVGSIRKALTSKGYVQVGGNETIGQGWFSLKWVDSK